VNFLAPACKQIGQFGCDTVAFATDIFYWLLMAFELMHFSPELDLARQPSDIRVGSVLEKSSSKSVKISIVVPCFNEAEGIANLRNRLLAWRASNKEAVSWECLLIDDGSTDATVESIGREFRDDSEVRVIQYSQNQGITAAILTGFKAAEGELVVCLDADCTYDPMIIDSLVSKIESGFDVVTASPYMQGGRVENVVAWRIGLSRIASGIYGRLFHSKLSCYTCCVRVYRAEVLRDCPPISAKGFVGVTELLWHLDRHGARIGEVPAVLRPRDTGVSKMRTMRTLLRHLRLMGRIITKRSVKSGVQQT
jgi:dolichol-phosphate mannosyltransferase